MSERDSTYLYHSVRSFSPRPNSRDPHLQNFKYVCIIPTFPKYLHLMKFNFGP